MRWLVRTFFASLLVTLPVAAASAQDEPVGDSADQTVAYSCGVASEAANFFMVVTQIDPQPDCSTYVSQDFPTVLDQDALALTSGLQTLCVTRNETTEFRLLWSNFGIAPVAAPALDGLRSKCSAVERATLLRTMAGITSNWPANRRGSAPAVDLVVRPQDGRELLPEPSTLSGGQGVCLRVSLSAIILDSRRPSEVR